MKFSYEDLLSGSPIGAQGIGHFRSPFLRELKPTGGIGTWKYDLYLNILSWGKEEALKFIKLAGGKTKLLAENDKLNAFDVMTLSDGSREMLQEAMAFFMTEALTWDGKSHKFAASDTDTNTIVGYIDRDNFDEVRDMMLQLNYISIGESSKPLKHSSKAAQELWERAQKYIKEESTKKTADKKFNLGNIISKLCAASTAYNLLNIYDLTVFQLYDQFFQYGYLRAMNLNEMAFCNHGGKNFDIQEWLKPIIKI